ncbi:hypothetical protein niasHT_034216 [Heterodera trifolii]|uniref:Glutathione synthetase n=1 Tax=Heterodera trifolii TaxID=157864 RepID=A0ABD2J6E5_9BILA
MSPSTNTDLVTPNYIAEIVGVNETVAPQQQLNLLVEDALDWAHCFGLVLRTTEHKDRSDVCQAAPFALFPSPFPRNLFDEAMAVQKDLNLLYFRISWDLEFLKEAHQHVIPSDAFTRKMLEILEDVHSGGVKQHITLLTQRADYMCHVTTTDDQTETARQQQFELKQIEVNNIAVSMGGLAQRASVLHRRMLQKTSKTRVIEKIDSVLPENRPIDTLTEGIHNAWKQFGDPNAILLVVVGEVNQNQFDQRFVEYEMEQKTTGQIKIVRLTLMQCSQKLKLDPKEYTLHLDAFKVAVVYFRAGYAPEDYPTQTEWEARRTIELSTAIKCPWIGLQVANTKKVQQVLDTPGAVERFFNGPADEQKVAAIRHVFAKMWGLDRDDAETNKVMQDAITNPQRYVLKPQLEGGGGNHFGEEIVSKLRTLTPAERAAFILMEKIQPLVVKNYLIRPFLPPTLANVVSELGIYGCLVGDGRDLSVSHNNAHGHILRTKSEHVNEGGVAVGAAVIDTPFLF